MSRLNRFPLLTGRPSLDLVNTEVVRRGKRIELLSSPADLLHWCEAIAAYGSRWASEVHGIVEQHKIVIRPHVMQLREWLRTDFEYAADGGNISDKLVDRLEQSIAQAPLAFKLQAGEPALLPTGQAEFALSSLIAYDALLFISERHPEALKRCSNPDCILLFVDDSGRRKWCSMSICGNRHKAASFQRRQAGEK
ncbi:CGNR zinc finger domain-containing protein [Paenibacillus sp. J5C_2022]|uniref:CGNR zinc finger domain-containing protein n=1 Tax=Paenibacillus sp. J5C2022 TaxID=2977129 RepID=UPI0021D2530E|nr:CGNR zinc finger domain-containing protein [Paenibacillus sp. J5C2022]MCU6708270.1 CGNR zinc finger domain-containing protein [Paenibacillus sp. J5C2022]